MGGALKLKEKNIREREKIIADALKRSVSVKKKNVTIMNVAPLLAKVCDSHDSFVIKTKNPDKIRFYGLRALLRPKYPVPSFLDILWMGDNLPKEYPQYMKEHGYRWWLSVAYGESFYKAWSSDNCFNVKFCCHHLTRKECHLFLSCGRTEYSVIQNIIFAKALAISNNYNFAHMWARSRVLDYFPWDGWKVHCEGLINDALMFFFRNPVNGQKLNDFLDFLHDNQDFLFKGRTLHTLELAAIQWHKDLANRGILPAEFSVSWIPKWTIDGKDKFGENCQYEIVQITNAEDLLKEGRSMHHCVAAYADRIKSGDCEIFTMRRYYINNNLMYRQRELTIEVNPRRRVVAQVRGPCNVNANSIQRKVFNQWCTENGLIGGQGISMW